MLRHLRARSLAALAIGAIVAFSSTMAIAQDLNHWVSSSYTRLEPAPIAVIKMVAEKTYSRTRESRILGSAVSRTRSPWNRVPKGVRMVHGHFSRPHSESRVNRRYNILA